ncbi:MAG: 1,4-dihydroxy-2-naphthoate octaprenyltransferase [Verrucomicrobiales bacterium]|nr:1,4-dihydroxy-2-naphthoate octaprenyltransferase [Verrucomicrobiales bacterium]
MTALAVIRSFFRQEGLKASLQQMKAWLLAARPKTLPAAIVPVWVGSMPLLVDGNPETGSWMLFWFTLVSCICIQIATNLFNDAIDHKKGADTEKRLGPRRVTASGLLSQKAVMGGALFFCLLAAGISIPLILERGWPIVAIGLVSLFFAYGYTGGPFPLAYRGMGELFVILFFGFVAVLGSFFVQSGLVGDIQIWTLGLQCGLYSSVLIAINNLRDIEEDRGTGKMTLAVRFVKTFARWEIAVFCLLPILLGVGLSLAGYFHLGNGLLFLLLLIIGVPIVLGVSRTEPSEKYNKFLAMGALQLLGFAALVSFLFS